MRALVVPLLILFLEANALPNSFNSLVFEFSSDLKTVLPEDGWVKLTFNVVNFGNEVIDAQFKAVCVESGKELSFHPLNNQFTLLPNEEQDITVFLNSHDGEFDYAPSGKHMRTIQYTFVNPKTKELLTFNQKYQIEIARNKAKGGK